jgi:hypothetical protein
MTALGTKTLPEQKWTKWQVLLLRTVFPLFFHILKFFKKKFEVFTDAPCFLEKSSEGVSVALPSDVLFLDIRLRKGDLFNLIRLENQFYTPSRPEHFMQLSVWSRRSGNFDDIS